jgi:CDP-glucose 4,6-dehydratase
MGTASLLEAANDAGFSGTIVMVTSDKVYENDNTGRKFDENDRLGGGDPYSASKAASEFIIKSYGETIFSKNDKIKLVSARSGNVIGGGDWASNRVVPDIIRSIETKKVLEVRSPNSTRPWMHVLDSINGYLKLASHISSSGQFGYNGSYNFGPNAGSYSVENILEELSKYFEVNWVARDTFKGCQEAVELRLNSKKARDQLGWEPSLQFSEAVECTAHWYLAYLSGGAMDEFTRKQIATYLGGGK